MRKDEFIAIVDFILLILFFTLLYISKKRDDKQNNCRKIAVSVKYIKGNIVHDNLYYNIMTFIEVKMPLEEINRENFKVKLL